MQPAKDKMVSSQRRPGRVSRMVEEVLGCKWTVSILRCIQQGICRPGMIEQSIPGLTTKVLNERLRKLVGFGILRREAYPEIPPHVEYHLTAFGEKFGSILEAIERLEAEWEAERAPGAARTIRK
jgi:DNA-binding HxlR family transcriptional regulator